MCRFLFRLPEEAIGRALAEVARRYPRRRRRARVAVDATGLSSGAISNFFVRRTRNLLLIGNAVKGKQIPRVGTNRRPLERQEPPVGIFQRTFNSGH
jgi:hypothetical protein